MKILFLIMGVFFAKSQSTFPDQKILIELTIANDFSSRIDQQNPAFGIGFWYRHPIIDDARLELGGNFKMGEAKYHFIYGKNANFYEVNSIGYIFNLGARMVKEFSIKNQKLEWISELTLNSLIFDGAGIPDDPIREPENENTIHIVIDAEAISSIQFGQGIRIWKGNIGFGLKASFTPYRLLYKTTVPNRFNVFTIEAGLSVKL